MMGLKSQNLYHPFIKSDLGFFVHDTFSTENDTTFVLENIDFYYQPVEEPAFGILFIVLGLIMLVTAEFIQFKLFFMVKRENGLVKEVTHIYSLSCIIMIPFWLIIPSITDFIHPLNEVIGEWFCFLVRSFAFFHFNIITMHSLIIAMMRYWFIVHEESVRKYGKEKTKRFFAFLSIFIPLFLSIWALADTLAGNIELDPFLFVNRCYGRDHKVFLINISPLEVFNPYFCKFGNYSEKGMYGKILETLQRASCISKTIIYLLMAGNFTEGIIYYRIFSHIKRFVICIKIMNLL
jgi:hypothetical protein